MDLLTISNCTWRGVAAWRISSAHLHAVVTVVGGHLAAIWQVSDGINPLWQPPWAPAAPAADYAGRYGEDSASAQLLATIVGHNWCCDRFGGQRPGEKRPAHGETSVVTWQRQLEIPARFTMTAWLPEAQLQVRTTMSFRGTQIVIARSVRHDDADARNIEWCEHVTVGDPFLVGAEITAGIDRVLTWPDGDRNPSSRFDHLGSEAEAPIAAALAMPASDAPPCGDVVSARVHQGWWSIANRRLNRRLTYRWSPDEYPWLALWTEHRSRHHAPWNGVTRARGMEFSTKPWPELAPPPERATTYQGRSTQCVVPPGTWRTKVMTVQWERMR